MRTKDSFSEQDVHQTDLSIDRILEYAYQRSGGTKGIKGPEQDERIKDKTRWLSSVNAQKNPAGGVPCRINVILSFR